MQFNMILLPSCCICLNIAIFFFACSCLQISESTQLRPAEHLVPPPPPPYALPLKHVKDQVATATTQNTQDINNGFMTRLARWFGFGKNAAQQQQLAPPAKGNEFDNQAETRHSYNYMPPNRPYYDMNRPCSLCNKYPWVPIFPISNVFRPQLHSNQWSQVRQQPEAQASQNYAFKRPHPGNLTLQQQIPTKQRAVQFDFLAPQKNSYTPYIWSPQTKGTQNEFSFGTQQHFETTTASYIQQSNTEFAQFHENVGAQSELQVNGVIATQTPATRLQQDASFEIIKSQQLTDYVSSVEYPATFVQAHAIDLLLANQQQTTSTEPTNTVKYQREFLDPNLSRHIPASQLLTDPNSFGGNLNISATESTTEINEELAVTTNAPPFAAESLVISNFHKHPQDSDTIVETTVGDNFPSASSQNFSHFQHNDNNLELWVTPSNEYFETTTAATTQTTTLLPLDEFFEVITSKHRNQIHSNAQRERETPKRLLNAPIQHVNAAEKASTNDPSALNYRLGAALNKKPQEFHYSNHAYPETDLTTPSPPPTTYSATEISATSSYGAIDASGHFAGISPPAPRLKQAATKIIQQVIVPYSTKNLPRPFEPNNADSDSSSTVVQHWSVDAHGEEQKKSNSRRNNKYLTKILATNLRELLHRERENKKKAEAFDIAKLRKNIDNWTEQQYTSQSHKSSTPTIRGRSKHIPSEYLTTTTPAPNKTKTTKLLENADLSTSINNLEPILQRRGSKRFDYVPIDDNRLLDLEPNIINHSFATTTTERTTTVRFMNKTSTPISPTVIASSAPKIHLNENRTKEVWQKTRVFISPQTKEKIYVVTPVPRFFPQRKYLTTPEIQIETAKPMYKPRFVVRPTPGSSTSMEASSAEYRAQLFGLMGLSAHVPAAPVEIIDGNSKVINVVTPSTDTSRTKKRSTMQPSPR